MKKTVLIIDDDFFIRSLLNIFLRETYEIVIVENGYKALLWMEEGDLPDFIITDLDMPEINGSKFLNHIQKSGFYRDIPVIVLTGDANQEVKDQCLQAGVVGFFTKPFNPPELLACLQELSAKQELTFN